MNSIYLEELKEIQADIFDAVHDFCMKQSINYWTDAGTLLGAIRHKGILPGTMTDDNVIVGAGAIVKGDIPANSIIAGNPAKVFGHTDEYGKRHLEAGDYIRT